MRRLLLVALGALTAAGLNAGASYASSCGYDPGTKAVTLTVAVDISARILRDGREIKFSVGAEPRDCGAATVRNTNRIVIDGQFFNEANRTEVVVDESGGLFAPGSKAERKGASEIEIQIMVPAAFDPALMTPIPLHFEYLGSGGPNRMVAGSSGIDMNADGDLDVRWLYQFDDYAFSPGGGADVVRAGGSPATGVAIDKPILYDGGPGDDALTGGPAADLMRGGQGNDVLKGGPGDDEFPTPAFDGGDRMVGNGGFDTVDYADRLTAIRVRLNGEADDGDPGERDNLANDVERVFGGRNDDLLVGNRRENSFFGGDGDDVLRGGDGFDSLFAGIGDDELYSLDGIGDIVDGEDGTDCAVGDPDTVDAYFSVESFTC